jgi:acetyl esterase/lipase
MSTSPFAIALYLDVYYPNNDSTDRPVYMFIHGGGFTGDTKTKPEIVKDTSNNTVVNPSWLTIFFLL